MGVFFFVLNQKVFNYISAKKGLIFEREPLKNWQKKN